MLRRAINRVLLKPKLPVDYRFPSPLVHTNDPWTIKNFKYLYRGYDSEELLKACIEKVRSFTMVTHDGLLTTYSLAKYVIQQSIPGDFVETGCCQGGAAAIMAYAGLHEGTPRTLHLFDSFEGLPKPQKFEYEDWMWRDWKIKNSDATGELISSGALIASKNDAETVIFDIVGYPRSSVFFMWDGSRKLSRKPEI
jgi:hypothetical protein